MQTKKTKIDFLTYENILVMSYCYFYVKYISYLMFVVHDKFNHHKLSSFCIIQKNFSKSFSLDYFLN